jgi:hypothetical protein
MAAVESSANKRIKGFQEMMIVIGLDNEKAVKAVAEVTSVYCRRRTQAARSLPPCFRVSMSVVAGRDSLITCCSLHFDGCTNHARLYPPQQREAASCIRALSQRIVRVQCRESCCCFGLPPNQPTTFVFPNQTIFVQSPASEPLRLSWPTRPQHLSSF